jgi:hypothetical protein
MNRRTFLELVFSAVATWPLDARARESLQLALHDVSEGSPAGGNNEILPALVALESNPYVAGAKALLSVYSTISSMQFQQQVLSELGDIKSELGEIHKEVVKILAVVDRLPDIIHRELEKGRKDECVHEIRSRGDVAETILAKYAPRGSLHGRPMERDDLAFVKIAASEVIKSTYKLALWGEDAHIGIAYGYSVYLWICKGMNYHIGDPKAERDKVVGYIKDCGRALEKPYEEIKAQLDPQVAEFARLPRRILLNAPSGVPYLQSRTPWPSVVWYYADLEGSFPSRFKGVMKSIQVPYNYKFDFRRPTQLGGYTTTSELIQLFPDLKEPLNIWAMNVYNSGYPRPFVYSKNILDHLLLNLNQRVRALLPMKSRVDELKALIVSADALAQAISRTTF